jgi:hypothetical protein
LINDPILEKSDKSKALTACIGYFKKNGLIFCPISENFVTV